MSKPLHIDWVAKNALDGMMQLSPIEELSYRRIIDMIYASDDHLLDDDESLKWSTKAGTKWLKVKQRLIALEKIEVIDGCIKNKICTEKLQEAHARIESASNAGLASANKRKELKNKDTASTGVGGDVPTGVPTAEATDCQPTTNYQLPLHSEDKSSSFSVVARAAPDEPVSDFQKVFDHGIERMPQLAAKNSYSIRKWLEAGASVELDILPTITRLAGQHVGSWGFFDGPVVDAKATRERPLPSGNAGRAPAATAQSRNELINRAGELYEQSVRR